VEPSSPVIIFEHDCPSITFQVEQILQSDKTFCMVVDFFYLNWQRLKHSEWLSKYVYDFLEREF